MKQKLIDFYLDWVNNYLSPSTMAEHYELSEEDCDVLIDMGRVYHEENVKRLTIEK